MVTIPRAEYEISPALGALLVDPLAMDHSLQDGTTCSACVPAPSACLHDRHHMPCLRRTNWVSMIQNFRNYSFENILIHDDIEIMLISCSLMKSNILVIDVF